MHTDIKANMLLVDDRPENLLAMETILGRSGAKPNPRRFRKRSAALPFIGRCSVDPVGRTDARSQRL